MSAPEDFNRLYADISEGLGKAMKDVLSLNLDHREGKEEIEKIIGKLQGIQKHFDDELHQLEEHAEWDNFTLAFFGETNAGKSTIIESLRILFSEEKRQILLQENENNLERLEQALVAHVETVRRGLLALHSEYTDELKFIIESADRLKQVVQIEAKERNEIVQAEANEKILLAKQESQERLDLEKKEITHRQQIAEKEAEARLATERHEVAQRLQIEQKYAISRHKAYFSLLFCGGALIGAAVAIIGLKLMGG